MQYPQLSLWLRMTSFVFMIVKLNMSPFKWDIHGPAASSSSMRREGSLHSLTKQTPPSSWNCLKSFEKIFYVHTHMCILTQEERMREMSLQSFVSQSRVRLMTSLPSGNNQTAPISCLCLCVCVCSNWSSKPIHVSLWDLAFHVFIDVFICLHNPRVTLKSHFYYCRFSKMQKLETTARTGRFLLFSG